MQQKKPTEAWMRTLADQGKISPKSAAALTDFVLKQSALKPEDLQPRTYERLLEMWYKRKNLKRVEEVFEVMRANGKLTDYGYCVYCKCLATRGQLAKAKELMAERMENARLQGYETLRSMVNYVAADNIEEGVKLFEKWGEVRNRAKEVLRAAANSKRQTKQEVKQEKAAEEEAPKEGEWETSKETTPKKALWTPSKEELKFSLKVFQYDDEMYSMIIGWCLKHGEMDKAQSYYDYRLRQKQGRCPNYTDKSFSARITAHEEALKKKNVLMAQYEDELRKLKEDPDKSTYAKALSSGLLRKPRIPVPAYPTRYTPEEYLKAFPVVFTSHLLRPLIDLEASGKELDPTWVRRIGDGLRNDDVRNGIIMIAQKIYVNDKKRYEVVRNLLKKMDLPYEELTRIQLPKIPHKKKKQPEVVPPKKKNQPAVKKWWLVGGRLQNDKDK